MQAIKMLRYLISFRLVGENDFLYPTKFKKHFRHLANSPDEADRFFDPVDMSDDAPEAPTHPLLGMRKAIQ